MIKVWSIPIRLMHWTLAISFAIAMYTRHSEFLRVIHANAGYVAGGVIVLRIVFGIVMRDFSAFRRFPPNPVAGIRYLIGLAKGKVKRYICHNPAGALAIYMMLFFGIITVLSGYMAYEDMAAPFFFLDEDQVNELHRYAAHAWLVVVCGHLLGVFAGSIVHKENLPLAMISGNKVRRLNPAGKKYPEIPDITIPEFMRIKYIEEAAYYIAERHGFQSGRAWDDWLEAEQNIEQMIKRGEIRPA